MDNLKNDFWQNLQIARIYRDKVASTYAHSFVSELVETPPPAIYFHSVKGSENPKYFTHEVSLNIPPLEFIKKTERLFMEFAAGVKSGN